MTAQAAFCSCCGQALSPERRLDGEMTSRYLSLRDAAAWAGVSPRTMRRWIQNGLPVYQGRARGKVLIRPADIEAHLVKRQAPAMDIKTLADEEFSRLFGSKNVA